MENIFGYLGWAVSLALGVYLFKVKSDLAKEKAEKDLRAQEIEKRLAEQKTFFQDTQNQMEKIFKGLASETLESQSKNFLNLAAERLDKKTTEASGTLNEKVLEFQKLLNPMKDTLSKLQTDLSTVEKERNEQFGKIAQQLSQVTITSEKLKEEASSLSKALRRPEVRGSWGEIQLKRVVELAGMNAFCDFDEQVSVRDDEKNLLKPDLIVRLPNNRVVVVDSKAVLDAFMDAVDAPTPEDKKKALERHAKNLRTRVQDLSKKSYWEQFDHSAEFAVLFIPNEALLSAAVEIDKSIIEDALKEKIIIATPTTLVALLKAIAYGWSQNQITENAQNMINQAKEFYDRLTPWLKHLSKVGSNLEGAVKSYNDSMSSLETRVLPSVRKLKELGFQDKEELLGINSVDLSPKRVELGEKEVEKDA